MYCFATFWFPGTPDFLRKLQWHSIKPGPRCRSWFASDLAKWHHQTWHDRSIYCIWICQSELFLPSAEFRCDSGAFQVLTCRMVQYRTRLSCHKPIWSLNCNWEAWQVQSCHVPTLENNHISLEHRMVCIHQSRKGKCYTLNKHFNFHLFPTAWTTRVPRLHQF